ncbi:MAG: nuclear transport factor 2 family protein [Bauldia sp.]|nr:nuclear transport factor 2 family protein [Bauldia sp.]
MRKTLSMLVAVVVAATPVRAQVTDTEAEAAVLAYVEAVAAGDRTELMAILAPEFQIQRPDGTGHGREAYVAGEFLSISAFLGLSDLNVTSNGDIMVVRYILRLNATLDGRLVEVQAPRLTVFRRDGDRWIVVAHANFAQVAPAD